MDVDEYAREVKPHHKRSKLLAFKDQIRALKHKGFSDMQVRDWLAQNGIQVSRENVRKFIKRHLVDLDENAVKDEQELSAPVTNTEMVQDVGNEKSTEAQQATNTKESPAERLRRLAQKQRDEAERQRFSHDKTGNNH
ncbi:hypothetical protein [Massilia putida]|uniref:hypothetical protein n=1 Tax=Massilia putida TaxID=1141883 RepID=UPI00095202FE|nr:hypothetical protein [Massilia putida]